MKRRIPLVLTLAPMLLAATPSLAQDTARAAADAAEQPVTHRSPDRVNFHDSY